MPYRVQLPRGTGEDPFSSGSSLYSKEPVPAVPPATEVYHATLRRWWALTARSPEADLAEIRQVHQEIVRLIDDVGEPTATQFRRHWAREWWQETGVCPYCGERGPYHDPARGGQPA